MRIKRFNNIWTMGLIICSALLVGFYVVKMVCPQFIVGVAELPKVVQLGQFIDGNFWAFQVYQFLLGFFGCYILFCACCRENKLNWKESGIVASYAVINPLLQMFLPTVATQFNYVSLVLFPFIILLLKKKLNKDTFTSTIICFSVDIMSQALSIAIRDVVILSARLNSATMTILMIDGFIWRILLYLFFNFKKGEQ